MSLHKDNMTKKLSLIDIIHLSVTIIYIAGAVIYDVWCIAVHGSIGAGLLFFPALAAVSLAVYILRGRIRGGSSPQRTTRGMLTEIYDIVVLAVCVIAVAFAATFSWYYIHAETYKPQPPDRPVDVIIVPGARAYGNSPGKTLQSRLDAALEQLQKYPDAVCVASGGQGPNENAPEASAMFAYLTAHGINPDRVFMEIYSHTTMQNLQDSMDLLDLQGIPHDCVLIVSSDYHVPRALMIARRLGINAYGLAAPEKSGSYAFDAVRDYFALIKSWLVDR